MRSAPLVLSLLLFSGAQSFGQVTLLGPSPYLSAADSPFTALAVAGYFHLEDFEDGLLNVPGVAASAGTIIHFGSHGSLVDSVDGDNGPIDGLGNSGHSLFGFGVVTFTFDAGVLGALPTHAGIVWTDGANPTFEAFGPGMVSLGTLTGSHADAFISGETAEDRFYGVIAPGGVLAIRITASSWEVDHLQYGTLTAVPEPATWTLLAGIAALFALVRRTRAAGA